MKLFEILLFFDLIDQLHRAFKRYQERKLNIYEKIISHIVIADSSDT